MAICLESEASLESSLAFSSPLQYSEKKQGLSLTQLCLFFTSLSFSFRSLTNVINAPISICR